jgi:YbbR domain-containing protein
MTALLRRLFLEDFWWKLFALVLAILVWLIVTVASQKEAQTAPRIFANLPVAVLSAAEDVHNFKVSPSEVEVTVRADAKTLQNLQDEDIRAIVDLTGVAVATDLRKPIQVSVPAGVTCLRVVPSEVKVIFPPDR